MTNLKSGLTIGKRIGIGFCLMLLATAAIGVSSLISIAKLGNEIDRAANSKAGKVDLWESLSTRVIEMRSDEQTMLIRMAMNDSAAAEKSYNAFNDEHQAIEREFGKNRDAGTLVSSLDAWSQAHREIWQLARKRHQKSAFKIFNERGVPLADQTRQAAGDFSRIERSRIAESAQAGEGVILRSRWTASILTLLFLIAGIVTLLIVRDSMGEIRRMAAELNQSSTQIGAAASQVASSSQSLAQGASAQAASLEETSASTEEITAMTRKNAENSRLAAEVMTTVDRNVKEGNRTLEEMVVSMREIDASSKKISKIIKVIEEIAFQTNILALNAAVEAARAGEAGMGFAVVAGEVRNLAQRSSQAAKDTAGLIEESIAKSNRGSTKLQQVSGVIRSITESASRVKTLVDEVNLGSQEQARGIDQISRAVTQMDQMTQSSAANAEESASASEQLASQARALGDSVLRLQWLAGCDDRRPPTPVKIALPRMSKTAPKQDLESFPLEDRFTRI